ncbi:MAG TPA: DUF6114 domain-containing protein, partial [Micromonosporaceae bacterium]|nr:DUF6114 domain-containing protein [Micromonosporaceae bacterium]
MTVDAAAPQDGRFTRGRRAFRRWRKARPFWGGLFLILSGLELLYSGNLSLGNIEIHLGLIGFYSYIIPLVVILCGALTWTLPSQRLFYGIVGNAAVVYSIVSVNLGGFLIGLLLGIVGGALSIAWVPDKRRYDRGAQPTVAGPNDDADGPGPDDTGSGLPIETDVTDPNDFFARPTDVDATTSADAVSAPAQEQQRGPEQNVEGEQRHPFRVRRHALDDSQRPAGDSGRHGGRALVIAVVGTTLAASAAFAVRYASPAAADTCTPTPLQSAIARAVGSSGKTNGGNTTGGNTNGGKSNGSGQSNGGKAGAATHKAGTSSGTSAPITAAAGSKTTGAKGDQPKPVASVIGGVVGLLGSVLPAASGSATDAATDAPTDPPSDPPSAPPTESPSPSAAPTENPTPTESPTPTPRPTVTSKPRPTPTASGRTATT